MALEDLWAPKAARRPLSKRTIMRTRWNPCENYCCPKCRHREAMTREGFISDCRLSNLMRMRVGARYLFVSCTLCGFTETYDMAVLARVEETKRVKRPVSDIATDISST
ncbi:MAG: hypothetical protein BWZ10_00538 [candidate division BRC1 bacterium ADurb.BinA364]|nr:MAG: hypothetical protein BWZ10_00538 [candidate division BRC1 bacterium ADurb.BinA364]